MNKRTTLVHVIAVAALAGFAWAQSEPPQARIGSEFLDPTSTTVLHLRTGYITSIRLPEAVNAVVLGDPAAFKAEHSEAEPQLVFFKPIGSKPATTNALITTRAGHTISLSLMSDGNSGPNTPVDYVLEYHRPRSLLVEPATPSFLIGETEPIAQEGAAAAKLQAKPPDRTKISQPVPDSTHWEGRLLRVAVRQAIEDGEAMTIQFAVLNASSQAIELLPPQVELSAPARDKHHKTIKAEPVPIKDYRLQARRLEPGARTEGTVVFERPSFKEARERLLLEIAQAAEVDHPVLVPIAFVSQAKGEAR